MRLRRKPWIDEAIKDYSDFLHLESCESYRENGVPSLRIPMRRCGSNWGRGRGISFPRWPRSTRMSISSASRSRSASSIMPARSAPLPKWTIVQLLRFDVARLEDIFASGEVDRFFINFCDPWPKKRHAKRRLTYRGFLDRYARLLRENGQIYFKSDNAGLFDFTLDEFRECGWPLSEVTYDLHNSPILNEAMTEYEAKFSAKGQPIFHCVATRPKEVIAHVKTQTDRPDPAPED